MVTHRTTKSTTAENFIRSAKPPTISAGVMQAKVIWKATNTSSGMVPDSESGVTPERKTLAKPPK